MDNASKALIMAGAILISVAIVGIGIYIFTTASGLTESAVSSVDSLEVSSFNSNVLNYCGENVRGTSLKQLISLVNVWNKQGVYPTRMILDDGEKGIITGDSYVGYSPGTLKDTGRYKVWVDEATGYDDLGFIKWVWINNVN